MIMNWLQYNYPDVYVFHCTKNGWTLIFKSTNIFMYSNAFVFLIGQSMKKWQISKCICILLYSTFKIETWVK